MKNNLLKLFLLLNGILYAFASCPSYPTIPTTSVPKTNPLVLTSASDGMTAATSSSRQLSMLLRVTPNEACTSGSVWNVFILTVTPASESEKLVLSAYIDCDTMAMNLVGSLVDSPPAFQIFYDFIGTLDLFVSVDLSTNYAFTEVNTKDIYTTETTSSSHSQSWSFDSSTKIYLCSNPFDPDSNLSCTFSRLQLFSASSMVNGHLGDITPVSKAFYPLIGDLKSKITSAASGYFGDSASSPTAGTSPGFDSSKSFVQISSQYQFLTIPLPSMSQDSTYIQTMTIGFWVRINETPVNPAKLFSLVQDDGTPIYTVSAATSINTARLLQGSTISGRSTQGSTMKLKASFKGQTMEFNNDLFLSTGTWEFITFTLYAATNSPKTIAIITIGDSSSNATSNQTQDLSATLLRIGDPDISFLGDVSTVRILSPGAGYLNSGDLCSAENSVEIGAGPYALTCSESSSFNPFDNKCYSSCPVDTVTPFTNAPLTLCYYEKSSITAEESGGLSGGAIAGIVVGSVAGVAGIAAVGYFVKIKVAKSAAHLVSKSKQPIDYEKTSSVPKSNIVSPANVEEIALK